MARGRTFSLRKGNLFEILDAEGRVVARGAQVHKPGFPSQAVEVTVEDGYEVRVATPEPTYWPREMLEPARDWRETVVDNRRKETA